MLEKPAFIQGIFAFEGKGLQSPQPFSPPITYKVPFDKRSQLIYFRAGSSSPEMVCFTLVRDGKPVRYFPIAAKGATHVPLAVVEEMHPETQLEVLLAAPAGEKGTVVLDIGMMEF